MKELYYRPLTLEDTETVLNLNLRSHDKEEAKVLWDCDPKSAIAESLGTALEAHVIIFKGEIVGACGVSRRAEGGGIPWFFVTDDFDRFNKVTVARLAKEILQGWVDRYGFLANVASPSPSMKRWLEWLGFTVEEWKAPYIGEFFRFHIRKESE